SDAVDLLDGEDEDLSVSHGSGLRGGEDRLDRRLDEVVGDANLEADFLRELHLDGRAAVGLDALGLAAVPLDPMEGQAAHLGPEEGLEDFGKLLGPDDRD